MGFHIVPGLLVKDKMEVVVAHLPVIPSTVLVLDIQTLEIMHMQDEMVVNVQVQVIKVGLAINVP